MIAYHFRNIGGLYIHGNGMFAGGQRKIQKLLQLIIADLALVMHAP